MVVMGAIPPGTLFGSDFRVLRPLGAGGMGAVYVVEQLSTGNHRALKVMDPQLLRDAEMRERFTNEARVGARMESDHIVQVIAAGVDAATEMPWLAMELLQGESLAQRLQRCGRLQPAEVLEVVSQLSHALDAAHRVGVVHRDLKPENIFLAAPRREGIPFTVKVLDFGIAKVFQGATSGMTASLGTPLWMAPEQTSPGADVAPATDLWAVGLLVFWMLTGHTYWRSARVQPPSLAGLMREIVLDPIEPPSSRAADFGLAGVFSPPMDAWLLTCLQRDVAHRFSSAGACRDALHAALGNPGQMPQHFHSVQKTPGGTVQLPSSQPLAVADTVLEARPVMTPASAGLAPQPVPSVSASAPPRRSLLPHVTVITCGTILLALIGSCVSVMIYGTYKADKLSAPSSRVHSILGFDSSKFDPGPFMPIADRLAREHDGSVELVQIAVSGIEAGKTVNLTVRGPSGKRVASYSYRADRAHRDYCMVAVLAEGAGVYSTQAKSVLCGFAPVPNPKCTVFEVRERAVGKGAPAEKEFAVTYRASADGKPTWYVTAGRYMGQQLDDCR